MHAETNLYYRQLCESLGVALVAADGSLQIRVWNDAATRMFGANAEAMMATPIELLFPIGHREQAMGLLGRALTTGEVLPFEFEHRDAQGGCRELIATFAPVIGESGARIGVSASLRDITHRIALQREAGENRKMAALGALAGIVAHHFNNTFGGIITSADFAAESGDRAVMRRTLMQSSKALWRASKLANGLLAFSDGQQHADSLSDFTEIIVSLVDDLEVEAKLRGVDVQTDIAELPVMPVPRTQTMTLLKNITTNAIEAMPDGGTLRVRVWLEDDEIITEIIDSGRGLDETARARVFEPFWTTKQEQAAGSVRAVGLGLAIANGLVQVLGGAIHIDSEPHVGSTFRITLPRPTG